MDKKRIQLLIVLVVLLLDACSPSNNLPEENRPSDEVINSYPLADYGSYYVGKLSISSVDASRDNRQVDMTIWYPAKRPDDPVDRTLISGSPPDKSGAPYPLLLSSTTMANVFAPYLVSRGFVWVSLDRNKTYPWMNEQMFNQPLDVLFALNWVADSPPQELAGMIDTNNVGTLGYSFDGYNSLVLGGARIDETYYLSQCPEQDEIVKSLDNKMSAFSCIPVNDWNGFRAKVPITITDDDDGLWQPITDDRIKAVMPMAGEGWWLFGERGLAAINRPVLIIAGSKDDLYKENTLIYEKIGTSDKAMIAFLGQDHMMVYDTEMEARIAHFASAFFSFHLQHKTELAEYYSQDFVEKHDDLEWIEK